MENIKYLNINELEKNYYCLINNYILIYENNIWKTINIGYDENEYQQLFYNLFDYHPMFKSLQYFKQTADISKVLKKNEEDNIIIYNNNKYYNRECLFNLFLNTITYYIINYKHDIIEEYFNILKENIICSIFREYDKNLDYTLKYKTKEKKETIDKIYFKKDILNDIYNLKLNIKIGFKNINCYPFIKQIHIYNNVLNSYILENDEIILFSILNNKIKEDYLNDFSNYKIENIIVKIKNDNKYTFIKTNEKFRNNIFFEDIIIDLYNKNKKSTDKINNTYNKSLFKTIGNSLNDDFEDFKSYDDKDDKNISEYDETEEDDINIKDDDKNNKKEDKEYINEEDEELTTNSTISNKSKDKKINKFKNIKIIDDIEITEEKNKEINKEIIIKLKEKMNEINNLIDKLNY